MVAARPSGWTLGRRVVGVRTLDAEDRTPIGAGRVLVRGVVVAAGGLVLGVGALVVLLSPLFDRSGRLRGWHDQAAGAEVLDVRGAHPDALVVSSWSVPPLSARVPGPPGALSLGPAPEEAGVSRGPVTGAQPVVSGTGLVLAPVSPERAGPDLDTRAVPVVRPVTLAFGLHPELEVTRPRRRPAQEPEQAAASSVVARVSADIEMTDGRRVTVTRSALVGRNPHAEGDAQLIRVVDPGRSVSKTHLQIGVEPGGVWVCDRGSTNGTIVTLPDGAQVICGTDQQVRLREGSTVAFGDHGLRLLRAPGTAAAS
ncbi:FHA domain-containing protein [Cellulomonas soli]